MWIITPHWVRQTSRIWERSLFWGIIKLAYASSNCLMNCWNIPQNIRKQKYSLAAALENSTFNPRNSPVKLVSCRLVSLLRRGFYGLGSSPDLSSSSGSLPTTSHFLLEKSSPSRHCSPKAAHRPQRSSRFPTGLCFSWPPGQVQSPLRSRRWLPMARRRPSPACVWPGAQLERRWSFGDMDSAPGVEEIWPGWASATVWSTSASWVSVPRLLGKVEVRWWCWRAAAGRRRWEHRRPAAETTGCRGSPTSWPWLGSFPLGAE